MLFTNKKIKVGLTMIISIVILSMFSGCTMVTDEPTIIDGEKAILRGWSAFGSTNNSYYFAFDSSYHDHFQNYSNLFPAEGPHDVYNYYHYNTNELNPGTYHYRFVRHHIPTNNWYQGDDVNFTIS